MTAETKEQFADAKRQQELRKYAVAQHISSILGQCPECNGAYSIYEGQTSFKCQSSKCAKKDIEFCMHHRMYHSRPTTREGAPDLNAPRICDGCVKEAKGEGIFDAKMREIMTAFVDRCPACRSALGEPLDFNTCMSLKCSGCPLDVCGFCFDYANDRQATHKHVRSECPKNPRENYFAESEAVWRQLMKTRRLGIAVKLVEGLDSGLKAVIMREVQKHLDA